MFSFSGSSKDTVFLVDSAGPLDSGREKLDFRPGVGFVLGTSVEIVPASMSIVFVGADGASRLFVVFFGVLPGAAIGSLSLCSSAAALRRREARVVFVAAPIFGGSVAVVPAVAAFLVVLVRAGLVTTAAFVAVSAAAEGSGSGSTVFFTLTRGRAGALADFIVSDC